MSKVTVMSRFAVGFGGQDVAERAEKNVKQWDVVSLEDAMLNTYDYDAHIALYHEVGQYGARETGWRWRKSGLVYALGEGVEVVIDSLLLDHDPPEHVATEKWRAAWSDAWLVAQSAGFQFAAYSTKNGFRSVARLSRAVTPVEYERIAQRVLAEAKERGLGPDEGCSDWTRLFRLPRVVRKVDGVGVPSHEVRTINSDGNFLEAGHKLPVLDVDKYLVLPEPDEVTPGRPFKDIDLASAGSDGFLAESYGPGERHAAYTRYAAYLTQRGILPSVIKQSLYAIDLARGQPPLQTEQGREGELDQILAWCIGRGTAVVAEILPPLPEGSGEHDAALREVHFLPDVSRKSDDPFMFGDHVELGEHLVRALQGYGDVAYSEGTLWIYNNARGYYDPLDSDVSRTLVQQLAHSSIEYVTTKGEIKHKSLLMKNSDVMGVHSCATRTVSKPQFFAKAANGVAFRNGFFRAEKVDGVWEGVLRPHSHRHRCRYALDFNFVPDQMPTKHCIPMMRGWWPAEEFVDADQRLLVLFEHLGICMLGLSPKYKQALILVGDGSNGKSVWLDLIKELFDRRTRTAVPPQMMGDQYRLAQLAGSRINVCTEMPDAEILNTGPWKAVLAGEEVDARVIRESPFSMICRAGFVYATNTLPRSRDTSNGFFRRMIVLEFVKTFQDAGENLNLLDLIVADELDALASYALACAIGVLNRGGFTIPSSSRTAVDNWRQDSDSVASWLAEATEKLNGAKAYENPRAMTATMAYSVYNEWVQRAGRKPLGRGEFKKRMTRYGCPLKKMSTRRGAHFYPVASTQTSAFGSH